MSNLILDDYTYFIQCVYSVQAISILGLMAQCGLKTVVCAYSISAMSSDVQYCTVVAQTLCICSVVTMACVWEYPCTVQSEEGRF